MTTATNPVSSRELQKVLDGLINSQDLMKAFDKSAMTIYIWRTKGGLPFLSIPGDARNTIRYIPEEVLRWAAQNGKRPRTSRVPALRRVPTKRRALRAG